MATSVLSKAKDAALDFLSPLLGNYPITTEYGAPDAINGNPHYGIDFGAGKGTPVYAIADGLVERADGTDYGGGNIVRIAHTGGYESLVAHLDSFIVQKGETVKKGEIIGYVGHSGAYVTGDHLHFEAFKDGQHINPISLFNGLGDTDSSQYSDQARRVPVQSDGNCPVGYHRRDDGLFGVGGDMTKAYCERDNILGDVVSGPAQALLGVAKFFAFLFDPKQWARIFALVGGMLLAGFGAKMVWDAV